MLSFEISDLDAMRWEGGSAASERSATLQREKSSKSKVRILHFFIHKSNLHDFLDASVPLSNHETPFLLTFCDPLFSDEQWMHFDCCQVEKSKK